MPHLIEEPIDEVYSIQGGEWHGFAKPRTVITGDDIRRLTPDIIQSPLSVTLANGKTIPLKEYKVLVADYSEARPETVDTAEQYVPLHVPKDGYGVIANDELFATVRAAMKDCDAEITTAGTLNAGKAVFFSVDIRGKSDLTVGKGDKFRAYLNFISSHDGSLALRAYDSTIRIVCMNTLLWSLQTAGNVGFTVRHTKNAGSELENVGELINGILKGREQFKEAMEGLMGVSLTQDTAREITAGYITSVTTTADDNGKRPALSGRSQNTVDAIATLFSRGKGNDGKSAYDLLNGATEYWTSGNGTGAKATAMDREAKARWGAAADHKTRFCNGLREESTRAEWREMGRESFATVAATAGSAN